MGPGWEYQPARVLHPARLPALIAMRGCFLAYSFIFHSFEQRANDMKEAMLAFFYSMNWAVALDHFQPKLLSHT
jgi:hypothetical protein